jgi:Holliday junction DNA helicase RuvA
LISIVSGTLTHLGLDHVVIECGGVGFKIFVPLSARAKVGDAGGPARLFTHLHVKEDALSLYGFLTAEERELFELLLTVAGVGPKVALGILSGTGPRDFLSAILRDDVTTLTRLPGVGKKIAQRLVLELKEKVGQLCDRTADAWPAGAIARAPASPADEAVEALVSLGYSRTEASRAIERAAQEAADARRADAGDGGPAGDRPSPDAGELVRLALRRLS